MMTLLERMKHAGLSTSLQALIIALLAIPLDRWINEFHGLRPDRLFWLLEVCQLNFKFITGRKLKLTCQLITRNDIHAHHHFVQV